MDGGAWRATVWDREELDMTEWLRMHASSADSSNMSLHKLWDMMKDREAWHDAVHGVIKNQT